MPLPPPAPRTALHRRRIECLGYRREDGLWDIEGELIDTRDERMRTIGRGAIAAGEPLHRMRLRLTVDAMLVVRDIAASIDAAPYPACPHFPRDRLRRLIGERIAPGWSARVRLALGGVHGCTHLVELLGPLASTAVQTLYAWQQAGGDSAERRPPREFIDSCHGLAAGGEVARRLWPESFDDGD